MIVFRRRLIFWLIKAYIKKSGKTLGLSFLLGLFIFFSLLVVSKYFVRVIPIYKKVTIGVAGAYTQDTLPPFVVNKLSRGLTVVQKDGSVKPDIASSWKIADNGKTYIFYLKRDLYFNDGKQVTSDTISYKFSDVQIEKPDKYTIVFKLKDAYSPFLVTLSRPVVERGSIGVGSYRIEKIKLNGNFIQSLAIVSAKDRLDTIQYQFYPTEEALKMAYMLGEVSQVSGLTTNTFKTTDGKEASFDKFPNTTLSKSANHSRLVTLFFNTTDSVLSDKKLRLGLTYALPETFSGGQRAYLPYSHESLFYNTTLPEREQDYAHAKLLLEAVGTNDTSPTIKTLKKYRTAADAIASSWKNIGINAKIEEVDSVPEKFQIFLGDFNLPKDPDQYTLWHSQQINNITKYKNLRIDKLLEDGRKTVDVEKRKEIYADFQKYLMEDSPAAFLYFPNEYELVRK